jgi:hypothetical protein
MKIMIYYTASLTVPMPIKVPVRISSNAIRIRIWSTSFSPQTYLKFMYLSDLFRYINKRSRN